VVDLPGCGLSLQMRGAYHAIDISVGEYQTTNTKTSGYQAYND
jgi:hypothetical protein